MLDLRSGNEQGEHNRLLLLKSQKKTPVSARANVTPVKGRLVAFVMVTKELLHCGGLSPPGREQRQVTQLPEIDETV